METNSDELTALLKSWLALPDKRFERQPGVDANVIRCDCAGLFTLLCEHFSIAKPYGLTQPRAVHYFAVAQEIGSSHISQLRPGSMLTWRKEHFPKSGDSGHVLIAVGLPEQQSEDVYRLPIVDATKLHNGLSRRDIHVHTQENGSLLGVRLHLTQPKVKRTALYHTPLLGSRYCLGCAMPKKVCRCGQIEIKPMDTEVIILRHPDERRKTLSTASLIKQRHPEILVKEGLNFSPIRRASCALLFPLTRRDYSEVSNAQTRRETQEGDARTTLILIDATWKKAKRMLHENPWLTKLPRLALNPPSQSDYILRKGPGGAALSTLEAFALVQNDRALQRHLRRFMADQILLMGKDTYAQNYRAYTNYSPSEC